MNETDYKGINTLIRTYELRLLKREDVERMLKAPDLGSVLDLLSGTVYQFNREETLRTKNFNQILMNHLVDVYRELFTIAPDSEIVELFTLKYSYHNLKVLLKQHFLEEQHEDLLIPIGGLSLDALRNLVETGNSEVAHPIMVEAVQHAKSDYNEQRLLEAITVYLDTYYFRHLRIIADRIDYEPITKMIDTQIDLYNLSTLVRSLNQGKPRSHLYTVLSSAGTISKQEIIDESMNGAVAVLRKLYGGKSYGSQLERVIVDNNRIDTLKLDKLMEDLIHDIVSEGLYQPFGPLPMLGFIYAKETEVTNLRLILVGKDNQIEEQILRERVREVYGS